MSLRRFLPETKEMKDLGSPLKMKAKYLCLQPQTRKKLALHAGCIYTMQKNMCMELLY